MSPPFPGLRPAGIHRRSISMELDDELMIH
jgi:hypothetical protein